MYRRTALLLCFEAIETPVASTPELMDAETNECLPVWPVGFSI